MTQHNGYGVHCEWMADHGCHEYYQGGLRRFCHGSKGGWVLPHPEVIKADPDSCPHAVLDEMAGIPWGFEDCVTCGKRFPMRSEW